MFSNCKLFKSGSHFHRWGGVAGIGYCKNQNNPFRASGGFRIQFVAMFIDRFAVASLQLESSVATTVRLQGIETTAWQEISSYSLIGGVVSQDRPRTGHRPLTARWPIIVNYYLYRMHKTTISLLLVALFLDMVRKKRRFSRWWRFVNWVKITELDPVQLNSTRKAAAFWGHFKYFEISPPKWDNMSFGRKIMNSFRKRAVYGNWAAFFWTTWSRRVAGTTRNTAGILPKW